MKHWFLQPSMANPRYVCGGWQIFNRMHELVSKLADTELITYRYREDGFRFLDDIARDELKAGIIWLYWQAHVTELAERLAPLSRIVLYAMNTDYGKKNGQDTPKYWPIVCLSRYISADYSIRHPWRLINYLGPVLSPAARNTNVKRDIDVLLHTRKNVPYVKRELIPALEKIVKVKIIKGWIPQEEFFALLNRSKTYFYWVHKQIPGIWIHEGFGMQPLEAIACGAIPISNLYGGLGDYLEAPHNCLKIGTHSLEYDIMQIVRAVQEHTGKNVDEERLKQLYGVGSFYDRFSKLE